MPWEKNALELGSQSRSSRKWLSVLGAGSVHANRSESVRVENPELRTAFPRNVRGVLFLLDPTGIVERDFVTVLTLVTGVWW